MAEWKPIYEVPELKAMLQGKQPNQTHLFSDCTNEITAAEVQKELQQLQKPNDEKKEESKQQQVEEKNETKK